MSLMQTSRRSTLLLTLLAAGCVSTGGDDNKDQFTIAQTAPKSFEILPATASAGLADYKYEDKSYKAEWLACQPKAAKRTILLMHRDRAGFDAKSFCQGWIAQAFLSEGFATIAVNRPGFGGSTGAVDFAGAHSIAAIAAGSKAAQAKTKIPAPTGSWGYSSGAVAAAFAARKMGNLKFLILGGGPYDLYETEATTADGYLKKELAALKKAHGDEAFETRSVAYDVSDLPKRIIMYHGKNDTAIAPSQAEAFKDSLLSSEYNATLQVVDGVAHDIPWSQHYLILKVLARAAP